jgi:hypothetical protein
VLCECFEESLCHAILYNYVHVYVLHACAALLYKVLVFSTTFQLPPAVLNKLRKVSVMHFNTGTFNTFCLVYIAETGQIHQNLQLCTHSGQIVPKSFFLYPVCRQQCLAIRTKIFLFVSCIDQFQIASVSTGTKLINSRFIVHLFK